MCVRSTRCGNEPGLHRPSNCDIFIQNEASQREEEHTNHYDLIKYVGNTTSNYDYPEYDWPKATIGTPPVYRGFSTSHVPSAKDILDKTWDHDLCHGFAEDGRSYRCLVSHYFAPMNYYVGMISVPFMDAVYPQVTYTIKTSDDTAFFVTVTDRVYKYASSVRRLRIAIIHGRNLDGLNRPEPYITDCGEIFRFANDLHDKLKRNEKDDVDFKYAIIIAKNVEADAFVIDPLKLEKQNRKWRIPSFMDGFSDRYGEPGYWNIHGYVSSSEIDISYILLHIDDRGTALFEINCVGEKVNMSIINSFFKRGYLQTPDTSQDTILKCVQPSIKELKDKPRYSMIPIAVYRKWSASKGKA